jgi:hypothetical protein
MKRGMEAYMMSFEVISSSETLVADEADMLVLRVLIGPSSRFRCSLVATANGVVDVTAVGGDSTFRGGATTVGRLRGGVDGIVVAGREEMRGLMGRMREPVWV